MEQLNHTLKRRVTEASLDPSFRHHEWFAKYHLAIVEGIAGELCQKYPHANCDKVTSLVWLHDYEKIVNFDNQHNTELIATRRLMDEINFPPESIDETLEQINIYNAKSNLAAAPIETQIVSSADAASHLVGPFIALYWYENSDIPIEELQLQNRRKAVVDWSKKVTLPEVQSAFKQRHQHLLEIAGHLPKKYLP